MDTAFNRLRSYARNNNLGLTSVAEQLVDGSLPIDAVAGARSGRIPPSPPRRPT